MSALRSILALFQIKVDDKELKRGDKAVDSFGDKLSNFAKVAAGAFAVTKLKDFVVGAIEAGDALGDTADKLGISADELQKWQYAGKLTAASAEDVAQGLKFLNKNMGEASLGNKEAVETFQKLGLHTKDAAGNARPLTDVMLDFSDSLSKLPDQGQRTAYAMKLLGKGGAALLPTLQGGREEIAGMLKEFDELGGGMGPDFLKEADKADKAIGRLSLAWTGLRSRLVVKLLPTLTSVLMKGSKLLVWFQKLARHTHIVGAAMSVLAGVGIYKVVKALGLLDKGVLSVFSSFLRFAIPIALLAALALIAEDVYTWLTGGESVIGKFVEESLGLEESNKLAATLRDAFGSIWKAIQEDLIPAAKGLIPVLVGAFQAALPAILFVVKAIAAATRGVAGLISVASKAASGDFAGALKAIDKTGEGIFGKGGVFEGFGNSVGLNPTQTQFGPAATPHEFTGPTRPGAGFQGPMQQQNSITVTVNGAKDAAGTAAAVKGALNDANAQNRQALAGMPGGGG